MRISMDIELQDAPGQLVNALKPISEFKGNLVSVVHHHEKRTPRGTIPVQVVFETESLSIDTLITKLEQIGVDIIRVDEKKYLERGTVILIGHIVHTDLGDTIDTIDKTGYAEVVELHLSMPNINQSSSASFKLDAVGKKELRDAISLLRSIADKKNIVLIEPIESEIL
ncbi:MAG: amino acid-binding protein [Methanomethylovorans sp.]|nr:amino acid-binding protein [Methanomethylovorans sp.]